MFKTIEFWVLIICVCTICNRWWRWKSITVISEIMYQITKGLVYLHSRHISHGKIAPSIILLMNNDEYICRIHAFQVFVQCKFIIFSANAMKWQWITVHQKSSEISHIHFQLMFLHLVPPSTFWLLGNDLFHKLIV